MNQLAELLAPRDVRVDIDVAGRNGLFEMAARLFEENHGIAREAATDSLLARERLGSTGLGHGVAIPHARIRSLKAPAAVVLRLQKGIAFDAPDSLPVSLFIFLFVPEAANQQHLELLSDIASLLSDRGVRERLLDAGDAAALLRAIARTA